MDIGDQGWKEDEQGITKIHQSRSNEMKINSPFVGQTIHSFGARSFSIGSLVLDQNLDQRGGRCCAA